MSVKTAVKYLLLPVLFGLFTQFSWAQKRDQEELPTEEINVVKPFSPTVSKANKIDQEPELDSLKLGQKKEMNYSIHSIPAASTFTPAKGKAKSLARVPKERFYENYLKAGYGNYNSPFLELFAHGNSSNYNDFGGLISLQSSGGGIEGVVLDNGYSDFGLSGFYKQSERYFDWQAKAGYRNLSTNWYGLSDRIDYSNAVIDAIDEKQNYGAINLGGDIVFEDALVHKGMADLNYFYDRKGSNEVRAEILGTLDFPVGEELIYTEISLDFLTGKFADDFLQTSSLSYTYFNFGLSPNFEMLREDLTVNIGLNMYYSATSDFDGSKFFIYPNITASYNLSDESLIAYAAIVGDLQQNSYQGFVEENPFVSPTLFIQRTSRDYYGYAGLKGLLNNKIRFNVSAGYMSERDKPLFKLNPSLTNGNTEVEKGYQAANSFQVVYDDVNTITFHAELIFDLWREFKFGGNVDFNSYSLDTQEHAWNLPMVKSTLLAQYKREKWSAGADVFFASNRKDELIVIPNRIEGVTNASYLDLNLNGKYNINDKFEVWLLLNNVLNQNYQEYTNFRVQGFQFLVGGTFKFDLQ